MEQTNVRDSNDAPDEDEVYQPVYELRPLSGQETLKVYRIVKDSIGNNAIQGALVSGGMEGAQGQVVEVLLDRLDYDVLPLMVAQIKGNEALFEGVGTMQLNELASLRSGEDAELPEDERPGLKELRRRETWRRVNQWMKSEPASAPVDVFNDFCAHDSFLAVFESASRSVRLVKKVSLLLGIDLENRGKSDGSQTKNSSNGPSNASGEG